jgi:methyltransferase (TIGR00027 family)
MRESKPSRTAAKVSRVLVYMARDPEWAPLLPAGAAEATEKLLLAVGGLAPWMVELYAKPRFHRMLDRLADAVARGQAVRMGLRKRFLDDEVRSAIAQGIRQVLVVGAGYDTLCLRLAAEHPELRFVEIDHPATHASKRDGVAKIGAERPNLELIAADLGQRSLAAVLAEVPGWDRYAPSIVVAEGVLMYLQASAIEQFLADVHDCTGPDSRLAFTWMRCDARGRPDTGSLGWLMRTSLEMMGEGLRWCVADEAALQAFLAAHGWSYVPDPRRFDLGRRYLEGTEFFDPDAQPIEFMAVATKSPAAQA